MVKVGKNSVNLPAPLAAAVEQAQAKEPGLTLGELVRRGLQEPEDCQDVCCRG